MLVNRRYCRWIWSRLLACAMVASFFSYGYSEDMTLTLTPLDSPQLSSFQAKDDASWGSKPTFFSKKLKASWSLTPTSQAAERVGYTAPYGTALATEHRIVLLVNGRVVKEKTIPAVRQREAIMGGLKIEPAFSDEFTFDIPLEGPQKVTLQEHITTTSYPWNGGGGSSERLVRERALDFNIPTPDDIQVFGEVGFDGKPSISQTRDGSFDPSHYKGVFLAPAEQKWKFSVKIGILGYDGKDATTSTKAISDITLFMGDKAHKPLSRGFYILGETIFAEFAPGELPEGTYPINVSFTTPLGKKVKNLDPVTVWAPPAELFPWEANADATTHTSLKAFSVVADPKTPISIVVPNFLITIQRPNIPGYGSIPAPFRTTRPAMASVSLVGERLPSIPPAEFYYAPHGGGEEKELDFGNPLNPVRNGLYPLVVTIGGYTRLLGILDVKMDVMAPWLEEVRIGSESADLGITEKPGQSRELVRRQYEYPMILRMKNKMVIIFTARDDSERVPIPVNSAQVEIIGPPGSDALPGQEARVTLEGGKDLKDLRWGEKWSRAFTPQEFSYGKDSGGQLIPAYSNGVFPDGDYELKIVVPDLAHWPAPMIGYPKAPAVFNFRVDNDPMIASIDISRSGPDRKRGGYFVEFKEAKQQAIYDVQASRFPDRDFVFLTADVYGKPPSAQEWIPNPFERDPTKTWKIVEKIGKLYAPFFVSFEELKEALKIDSLPKRLYLKFRFVDKAGNPSILSVYEAVLPANPPNLSLSFSKTRLENESALVVQLQEGQLGSRWDAAVSANPQGPWKLISRDVVDSPPPTVPWDPPVSLSQDPLKSWLLVQKQGGEFVPHVVSLDFLREQLGTSKIPEKVYLRVRAMNEDLDAYTATPQVISLGIKSPSVVIDFNRTRQVQDSRGKPLGQLIEFREAQEGNRGDVSASVSASGPWTLLSRDVIDSPPAFDPWTPLPPKVEDLQPDPAQQTFMFRKQDGGIEPFFLEYALVRKKLGLTTLPSRIYLRVRTINRFGWDAAASGFYVEYKHADHTIALDDTQIKMDRKTTLIVALKQAEEGSRWDLSASLSSTGPFVLLSKDVIDNPPANTPWDPPPADPQDPLKTWLFVWAKQGGEFSKHPVSLDFLRKRLGVKRTPETLYLRARSADDDGGTFEAAPLKITLPVDKEPPVLSLEGLVGGEIVVTDFNLRQTQGFARDPGSDRGEPVSVKLFFADTLVDEAAVSAEGGNFGLQVPASQAAAFPNGKYQARLSAEDLDGNETSINFTAVMDVLPIRLLVSDPLYVQTEPDGSGKWILRNLKAEVKDNGELSFWIDEKSVAQALTTGRMRSIDMPLALSFKLEEGEHLARAYLKAAGETREVRFKIIVDNTPPKLGGGKEILSGKTLLSSQEVAYNLLASRRVSIRMDIEEPHLKSLRYVLGKDPQDVLRLLPEGKETGLPVELDLSGGVDHVVGFEATDFSGNRSYKLFPLRVDEKAPEVSVQSQSIIKLAENADSGTIQPGLRIAVAYDGKNPIFLQGKVERDDAPAKIELLGLRSLFRTQDLGDGWILQLPSGIIPTQNPPNATLRITDAAGNIGESTVVFVYGSGAATVLLDNVPPRIINTRDLALTGRVVSKEPLSDLYAELRQGEKSVQKIWIVSEGKLFENRPGIAEYDTRTGSYKAALQDIPESLTLPYLLIIYARTTSGREAIFEDNQNGARSPPAFFVDRTPPKTPTLDLQNVAGSKAVFSGTGDPDASRTGSVELVDKEGKSRATTRVWPSESAADKGSWVKDLEGLAPGDYEIRARGVDEAGNKSELTQAVSFTIVSESGGKPKLFPVVAGGVVTETRTPAIKGTAGEASSEVLIYDNGNSVGRVFSDASGNFTWTPEKPLFNGTHNLKIRVVSTKTGALSDFSDPLVFRVSFAGGIEVQTLIVKPQESRVRELTDAAIFILDLNNLPVPGARVFLAQDPTRGAPRYASVASTPKETNEKGLAFLPIGPVFEKSATLTVTAKKVFPDGSEYYGTAPLYVDAGGKPKESFSPNGDGINDLLRFRPEESPVKIYNSRSSHLVAVIDAADGYAWNGKLDGSGQPAEFGMYFAVTSNLVDYGSAQTNAPPMGAFENPGSGTKPGRREIYIQLLR